MATRAAGVAAAAGLGSPRVCWAQSWAREGSGHGLPHTGPSAGWWGLPTISYTHDPPHPAPGRRSGSRPRETPPAQWWKQSAGAVAGEEEQPGGRGECGGRDSPLPEAPGQGVRPTRAREGAVSPCPSLEQVPMPGHPAAPARRSSPRGHPGVCVLGGRGPSADPR